jgi:hypothetical protein
MDNPEDFFEEDETLEERQTAWRRGEPGVTKGKKDLNERARSAIDAVIDRWDRDESTAVETVVVNTTGWFGEVRAFPVREFVSNSKTATEEPFPVTA